MLNYLLFFLLPIYLIRIPLSNSVSINLLEILLILIIILNFYKIFQIISFKKILHYLSLNKNILVPIFFILSGFTLSYFINQTVNNWANWSNGLGKLLDLIILPIIYTFSVLFLVPYKIVSIKKILISYYLSASLISIIGFIYTINHWLTFDNRLTIFFQSPNQLAIFISPAILINLYLLFKRIFIGNTFDTDYLPDSYKTKLFLSSSLLFLLFNLYQTFSLGAWLAIIFSSIFLLTKNNSIHNYLLKFILFIFITSTICILSASFILSSINYQPNIPPTSSNSRLTIYQVDQQIISKNWLFGIGANNFQNIYLQEQKYFPPFPQWAIPHAHNNFIHFWIEGGILAGLGLLLLTYKIISKNFYIKNNPSPPLNHIFLAILIYFIIHGIVDTTLWLPPSAILFFVIYISYFETRLRRRASQPLQKDL